MKSIKPVTLCLGIVILLCLSSAAQDTNKTAAAIKEASQVTPHVLDIDYGYSPAILSDQPTQYIVQLPVGSGKTSGPHPQPDVSSFGFQVWLLKTDGSSIPLHSKLGPIGVANAGWYTDSMMYVFEKVPTNELVAVVIRAKGKLYSQLIETQKQ